jgi:hypothetical protein
MARLQEVFDRLVLTYDWIPVTRSWPLAAIVARKMFPPAAGIGQQAIGEGALTRGLAY